MVARKRLSEAAILEIDAALKARGRKKVGPKSTYDKKYAPIAKQMCSWGARDADLADAFGVTTFTIAFWQTQFPEFKEAIRSGKVEVFDPLVERALAQRAIGYSVDTEEVKITKDGDEVRYQVRKHYPPETTACIFWLKNRQPGKWRDIWKIEHDGKIEMEKLTASELLDEIRKEAAELGIPLSQLGPAAAAQAIGVAPAKANGKANGTKH